MAEMQILQGMGVSGGIAIGRAVCLETRGPEVFRLHIPESQVEKEVARLREGVDHARGELKRLRCRAEEDLGNDLAAIFDAHILLLSDTKFLGRVEERIRTHHVNAEWAVHKTAEELDNRFAHMDDPYIRERSEDLTDVSRHLLRSLQGISHHDLELPSDIVIVADDLTPSDAIRLGRERVIGFAIETGGRTSHTTIIARSLNIPAVAGLVGVMGQLSDEAPVIVDGESGRLILHPTREILRQYMLRKAELERRDRDLLATRELAAETRDGVRVALMANIDLPEEVEEIPVFGAAGVGLYRSEFLYIEKSPHMPTEEEHVEIYRRMVETAAPNPAIIRTYDLGGRKLAREMMATQEENPVLGLRGIRLTLARPEVFRRQIRALYRAGLYGDLWVMLPLVSTVEEVLQFRAFADSVMAEMEREGVPFRRDIRLGVMIEVPAAAMIADILAQKVDFFSIGTNDLIQYSLAVDRNNEHVASLYQPLHPAILRMLRFVIDSGRAVGLGLRRISMSPRQIPEVKTWIREASAADLAGLAAQCMEHSTAAEVQRHMDSFFECSLPSRVSASGA
jgi:phosphotransferase system enzyme I (PtsI)